MKKEFEILKDRPKLSIKLTRDSVCAGDDVDAPHKKTVTIPSFTDPVVLIQHLISSYLPSVSGYGHYWDAFLNGQKLATLRTEGIESKILCVEFQAKNNMHFKYHPSRF